MQTIWRYDYAGIVVLTVSSFVPVVYYTFLCEPATKYFYLISTGLLGTLPCPTTTCLLYRCCSSSLHPTTCMLPGILAAAMKGLFNDPLSSDVFHRESKISPLYHRMSLYQSMAEAVHDDESLSSDYCWVQGWQQSLCR